MRKVHLGSPPRWRATPCNQNASYENTRIAASTTPAPAGTSRSMICASSSWPARRSRSSTTSRARISRARCCCRSSPSRNSSALPVLGSELLEMIIRFYGGPMQALLSRYLEQAFTAMLRQQEAMQIGNGQGAAGAVRAVHRACAQEHGVVGADAGRDARAPSARRAAGRLQRRLRRAARRPNPNQRKASNGSWIFATRQWW